jgi:hypothetical protein
MFRQYVIPGIASTALLAALALSAVSLRPQAIAVANAAAPKEPAAAPQQQIILPNQYLWSYAAKFVCGYQSPFPAAGTTLQGEPVYKPGNYATSISIHNPQYRGVKVFKKIVMLVDSRIGPAAQQKVVREPESAGMVVSETIGLGPDYATLDDCNRIYSWLAPASGLPAFPAPLISGYLVVLSRTELDVDTTYTADAPGAQVSQTLPPTYTPTQPTGISIDEERVTGKRIPVPTSLFVP